MCVILCVCEDLRHFSIMTAVLALGTYNWQYMSEISPSYNNFPTKRSIYSTDKREEESQEECLSCQHGAIHTILGIFLVFFHTGLLFHVANVVFLPSRSTFLKLLLILVIKIGFNLTLLLSSGQNARGQALALVATSYHQARILAGRPAASTRP